MVSPAQSIHDLRSLRRGALASSKASRLRSRQKPAIRQTRGRLAQLVERFVYTEDVGGSSPSSPTIA